MARDKPTIFPLSLVVPEDVSVVSVPLPLFRDVGIDRAEDVAAANVEERAVAAKDVTDATKEPVVLVGTERIDGNDDIGGDSKKKARETRKKGMKERLD